MKQTCILVSPVCPNPHGSGLEQRAFHLLCDYAARYRVTLVLVGAGPFTPKIHGAARDYASSVVELRTRAVSPVLQCLALLFPVLAWLRPALASGWLTLDGGACVPELPAEIDRLIVFRLRTASVAKALVARRKSVVRTILDLDDHESATLCSIGWVALRRGRLRLALRSLATSAQLFGLERRLLRAFEEISYSSPADRSALLRLASPGQSLRLRSNRALLPSSPHERARDRIFTMLFIGTLSYFPNEDAALWITKEVVPELRKHVQGRFRVLIAGRNASSRLIQELNKVQEIVHLGPVEGVTALYAQTDIALMAVRCGGGTKVKLLEAAAHQSPIVATAHSLRGLPFLSGKELLCASDPASFARQCAAIQQAPEAAKRLAARAYARVADMSS